jgi:hypothetical protein
MSSRKKRALILAGDLLGPLVGEPALKDLPFG